MYNTREHAVRSYRQHQIETAGPERLLLMLYDGLIACLQNARQALVPEEQRGQQAPDLAAAHNHLVKAQRLVQELRLSVDPSVDGMGPMLLELYDLLQAQLVRANINKDAELVAELIGEVSQLRDTWAEVFRRTAAAGSPKGGQTRRSTGEAKP